MYNPIVSTLLALEHSYCHINSKILFFAVFISHLYSQVLEFPTKSSPVFREFLESVSYAPITGAIWHPPCSYCASLSYPFPCPLHRRFLEYDLEAAAVDLKTLLCKLYGFFCCLVRNLSVKSSVLRRRCSTP